MGLGVPFDLLMPEDETAEGREEQRRADIT